MEPYIADFGCLSLGLLIELDGATHDAQRDAVRDADLTARGYRVLRFTNIEVGANLEGVLATILSTALCLPPRRCTLRPTPSPSGEGAGGGPVDRIC